VDVSGTGDVLSVETTNVATLSGSTISILGIHPR
jgi:hypothetical protein